MARRTRLYNTRTGRWEYMTVITKRLKTPWRRLWILLRAAARFYGRHDLLFPRFEAVYDFDPETLEMRDPKRERRMRRRDRRDRLLAKAANALTAMVEMQKHIG